MDPLDRLIAAPSLVEIDGIDVAAPAAQVWARIRHGALGDTTLTRALFALRTLAERRGAASSPGVLRLDAMRSTAGSPGFQVLVDEPPHEVAVGAIGQVWRIRIPFVHVADAAAFAAFAAPGFIKVAWSLRVASLSERRSRVEVEVRVAATSADAWRRFRRYFRLIGPGSRYIRRALLRGVAAEATAAGAQTIATPR